MRRHVEFQAEDRTWLRGVLYAREGVSAQGLVMTHGLSGVKEQVESYATRFAEAGFSVLLYDHRGFGGSDGEPRQEVDPARQLADWRDAITFALDLPEFDSACGVGVWGSSFAGGLTMVLAADDRRVRCVVAQIPNVGGRANGQAMFNSLERARLQELFDTDRKGRLAGEVPLRVPVMTSETGAVCALPMTVSANYIRAAEQAAPAWVNEVTVRSVEAMLTFEPAGWVAHVAPTPLLMIVAAKDICTFPEAQLAAFAAAGEPKRLVIHSGGHFDTYRDHFAETSDAALQWFCEHLQPET